MNKSEKNYWSQFYKNKNIPSEPSNFCKFIYDHEIFDENKMNILDCGCGNGRDSYYFSKKFNVTGLDTSSKPVNKENCKFIQCDFCSYNKDKFDIIYSRFTFHSISNQQQIDFLKSITKGSYLCIETRSDKTSSIKKVHGDDHYRNYTNYNKLINLLYVMDFNIIYSEEKRGFAIYKDEDPCCIRIICQKI